MSYVRMEASEVKEIVTRSSCKELAALLGLRNRSSVAGIPEVDT